MGKEEETAANTHAASALPGKRFDALAKWQEPAMGSFPPRYTVDLETCLGDRIGLTLEQSDSDLCLVKNVALRSLAQRWNSMCHPSQVISLWHRLLSVNGQMGQSSRLFRLLEASTPGKLELEFEMPLSTVIRVPKESATLGLHIEARAMHVQVNAVLPNGVFEDYNRRCPVKDHRIDSRSRIIAVNGTPQAGPLLVQKLKRLPDVANITVVSWSKSGDHVHWLHDRDEQEL